VSNTLADLGGDWALDLNGKQVTTPLKSWEDLGTPSFAGPATYRKQFTAPALPAGKRVFLEIADVHDYARVKLNGKELEGRAWQPYRWEVTNAGEGGLERFGSGSAHHGDFGGPPPAPAGAPGAGGTAAAGGRGGRGQGAAGTRFNDAFVWDGLNWMKKSPPTSRGDAAARRLRGRAPTPPVSGLLGPVRLVAR
jgi:hypothetical protein